jgi:hypothetical protein
MLTFFMLHSRYTYITIKSLLHLVVIYIVFQMITGKNFSYHIITVQAFEQYKLCYSKNRDICHYLCTIESFLK